MKLTTFSEALHKDAIGSNQQQRLWLVVDYDPEMDTVDEVLEASLYINNMYEADITNLLDNCPGSPLETILQAIPWREIYYSQKTA